jgi:hypothetical protein
LVGSIALDYITRKPVRFVRVTGAGGGARYNLLTGTLATDFVGKAVKQELYPVDGDRMYERQMKAFLRVLDGEKDPGSLATLDESIAALELCDAWRG